MNVLVTGGSGFIGTSLVRRLIERQHAVCIFDKEDSHKFPKLVCRGDVRDGAAVMAALKGRDLVYHLAAEHADDVRPTSLYDDVNVDGTRHLVAALVEHGVRRAVFTSTVALYGLNRGAPDEQTSIRPFNAYGRSKHKAENLLLDWARADSRRSLTIVRPAVIFGEGNRGNVYNLLRQIHRNRFIQIGNGSNRKSMGYVENITAFLADWLTFPPGVRTFNYADKADLTMNELVLVARAAFGMRRDSHYRVPYLPALATAYCFDSVTRITGLRFPISSVRVKKFCAETVICTRTLTATGFRAPYSLEAGLRRMIAAEFLGGHPKPANDGHLKTGQ